MLKGYVYLITKVYLSGLYSNKNTKRIRNNNG